MGRTGGTVQFEDAEACKVMFGLEPAAEQDNVDPPRAFAGACRKSEPSLVADWHRTKASNPK